MGSTGSQRLFRSGVPTIGGELGGGVSRVAPFVKEAPSCPRLGQMSNTVGNQLPSCIYTKARAHTHAFMCLSQCVDERLRALFANAGWRSHKRARGNNDDIQFRIFN